MQENAMTTLLNLSSYDNKAKIVATCAIEPLVDVFQIGNLETMENAATTLFSLLIMDDKKVTISASRAIPPLVSRHVNK
jgi:hypothetical protein